MEGKEERTINQVTQGDTTITKVEDSATIIQTDEDEDPDVQMTETELPPAKIDSPIDDAGEEVDVEGMSKLEIESPDMDILDIDDELEREIIEALHRSDGEDEGKIVLPIKRMRLC
jgi:hypothetical protein